MNRRLLLFLASLAALGAGAAAVIIAILELQRVL
jgi:hypothetical protein